MKSVLILPCLLTLFVNAQQIPAPKYPDVKRQEQTDDYFGTKVNDPYRWLEDDNSAETKKWVEQQNEATFSYLKQIPYRDKIKRRLTEIWNYEKRSANFSKGKYYFFYKNDGVQNQSVLYIQEGMNGKPKPILDPNKFSADGTVSLSGLGVSKDSRYIAYSTSRAGSDWNTIQIIETHSGKRLEDQLEWVKFSNISWYKDGFFYSRYDAPEKGKELSKRNEFHKVYYHRIGQPQSKDSLIYVDKDRALMNVSARVTEDSKFLIVTGNESTSGNSVMFKELGKNTDWTIMVSNFSNDHWIVDSRNGKLIVFTNLNAPKYKLVEVDVKNPDPKNWKDLVPEGKDLLESATLSKDKLVLKYLKDVTSRVHIYSLTGKFEKEISLPGIGMVGELNGDPKDSLLFFTYTTFTAPPSIYKYNIQTGTQLLLSRPKIDFKSEDYETRQVFYTSKDGTKIPMFITHKKGLTLDGNNPAFLFGYGGFNISYTPEFRTDRAIFLENGGVYAVANLRGGGEYGEDWHKAGTLCNKQNVFDDFIAAAEYLVKEKYTSHSKLAIHGRSNGGLLIGAVITQRPDIAAVAIPTVGVLDMLRYHMFTIGWAWATDYGRSDNKDHFPCLYKYSPLHNVKPQNYPATLVTTADHDDRVVPAHSFKFISTLQQNQKGDKPVLIRVDVNAGHGAGKPTSKQIEEFADMWAFVFHNLGMKY